MKKDIKAEIQKRALVGTVDFVERAEGSEGSYIGVIKGRAVVFDSLSENLGGFVEVIERGALDEADMSRVVLAPFHNMNMLLGRTENETLKLELREDGLYYECQVSDTQDGRDMIERVKRGDIDASSFRFRIEENDWEETPRDYAKETGIHYKHIIRKISIVRDVAPVVFPAYQATSSELRSFIPDSIKNKVNPPKQKFNKYKYQSKLL